MILKAQVAGTVFVGLLYGLSSLARPFFPIAGDYSYNDHELRYLDNIWSRLVRPYFRNFSATKVDCVILMGYQILSALLKPVSADRESYRADLLLNKVFLDGTVARARTPQAQGEVVERVLAASVQPGELPGWSARWIVSRTEVLLGEFGGCLEGLRAGMRAGEWKCAEDGTGIMPVRLILIFRCASLTRLEQAVLFGFWTDLITIFSKTVPNRKPSSFRPSTPANSRNRSDGRSKPLRCLHLPRIDGDEDDYDWRRRWTAHLELASDDDGGNSGRSILFPSLLSEGSRNRSVRSFSS